MRVTVENRFLSRPKDPPVSFGSYRCLDYARSSVCEQVSQYGHCAVFLDGYAQTTKASASGVRAAQTFAVNAAAAP